MSREKSSNVFDIIYSEKQLNDIKILFTILHLGK